MLGLKRRKGRWGSSPASRYLQLVFAGWAGGSWVMEWRRGVSRQAVLHSQPHQAGCGSWAPLTSQPCSASPFGSSGAACTKLLIVHPHGPHVRFFCPCSALSCPELVNTLLSFKTQRREHLPTWRFPSPPPVWVRAFPSLFLSFSVLMTCFHVLVSHSDLSSLRTGGIIDFFVSSL